MPLSLRGVRGLVLLLVLLAMLPVFALVLFSHAELRASAIAGAQDDALRLARVAVLEQENAVKETRQLLIALAASPALRQGASACAAHLAAVLESLPRYVSIGAASPTGDVLCTAVAAPAGRTHTGLSYLRRVVDQRRFAVGEYQLDPLTGRAAVHFGYPILDTQGQVERVVFAALDVGWLNHLAARTRRPHGSTLSVFDTNGLVLARHPDGERWVGKTVADAPIVRAVRVQRGEATAEDVGLDGVQRLYAFAPLPRVETDPQVFVVVGIPNDTVLAIPTRLLRRNLVGAVVAALLALVVAWIGTSRLQLTAPSWAPAAASRGARSAGLRYPVAALAVGIALGVQWLIWPLVEPSVTPVFLSAVMLAAWYGGLGPGLLATALASLASAFFFMPPVRSLAVGWDDLLRLVLFGAAAALISALTAQRLRAEEALARRVRQQSLIVRLGRMVLGGSPLPAVAQEAVTAAATGLAVTHAAVFEIVPDRSALTLSAGSGWSPDVRGAALELDETSLAQRTLLAAEPVMMTDAQSESGFTTPRLLVEQGIRAGLSVRIVGGQRAFGILGAYGTRPQLFSPEDVDFFQSVGHVLSLAVQREGRSAGAHAPTVASPS